MKHLILFEDYSKSEKHTLTINNKGLYDYRFTVDGVDMVCYIYRNPYENNYYDIDFGIVEGGKVVNKPDFRVGKTIIFLNSVLKTVADCMISFIESKDKVRILAYRAEPLREKVYNRFFDNHKYFPILRRVKLDHGIRFMLAKTTNMLSINI